MVRRSTPDRTRAAKGLSAWDLHCHVASRFFADKHTVLTARDDPRVVVINALGAQFHGGLEPSRYGRLGRIPGSVNVPAARLYDPTTKTFANLDEAERQFAAQGVTRDKQIIAYCGGGISAIFSCCAVLDSKV